MSTADTPDASIDWLADKDVPLQVRLVRADAKHPPGVAPDQIGDMPDPLARARASGRVQRALVDEATALAPVRSSAIVQLYDQGIRNLAELGRLLDGMSRERVRVLLVAAGRLAKESNGRRRKRHAAVPTARRSTSPT
jgi:hypothetical protein